MNTSLDRELVARLHKWRKTQTAEVPLGRALDACMREFLEAREANPRKISGAEGA